MGWDNNVHVPVHPQAQQPHHLSCCPADTGSDGGVGWGGVGWGGIIIITFMFPCTHRHSNLIIFLAVLQTQAVEVEFSVEVEIDIGVEVDVGVEVGL